MGTAHVGSMHRRSLFDRLGRYDTSYRIVADYEFLLRAQNQLDSAFMPTVTVKMRAGGGSDSRNALKEHARAIVATGGRSKMFAAFDLYLANAKFALRPLRYVLPNLIRRHQESKRAACKTS